MWLNNDNDNDNDNENKNSKEHYEKVRNYFRGRVKDNGTTDGRKTGASEAISGDSPTGINERGGTRVGQAEQGKEGREEVEPTEEDIAKANEGVDFEGLFAFPKRRYAGGKLTFANGSHSRDINFRERLFNDIMLNDGRIISELLTENENNPNGNICWLTQSGGVYYFYEVNKNNEILIHDTIDGTKENKSRIEQEITNWIDTNSETIRTIMSESGFANRENGDYIRYILGERTSRGDRVVNGNGKIEWGSEITRTDSEDITNGSGEKRIKNTNDSDGRP